MFTKPQNTSLNSVSVNVISLAKAAALALALTMISSSAVAQSMLILGGNSDAQACYRAAGTAAQFKHADRQALNACNTAIEAGNLQSADLLASYVNRGIVLAAREEYTAAVADYRRAERMNPNSPEVAINIGNLWFMSGHFDEAIERYSFVLDNSERHRSTAHYNRGMAFENAGDAGSAVADYQAALDLAPEWERVRSRLEKLQSKQAPK